MKNNTANPGTSKGIGEQWMPVPTRLVDAVMNAPNMKRRAWAVAYLVVWMLAFCRSRQKQDATLGDLEAWSSSKARHRTIKAKKDALKALAVWEKRTENEPETNQKRTKGNQVEPISSDSNELETNQKRTARGRVLSTDTTTELQNPHSPPAGDVTPEPVPSSKPDRVAEVWASLEAIRLEVKPKARGLMLSKPRRRAINARIKEHSAEALRTVWRWWLTSDHDRAVFLRSNCSVDTLLQASKFTSYLEFAEAPTVEADTTIPASPAEAWSRIQAALDDPSTGDCPGPDSGWHLWPLKKDPRVHLAMMDALQTATGQDYPPHAWQMAQQARRSGADSFDLNQLGRAFRKAYPSTWSARVAA